MIKTYTFFGLTEEKLNEKISLFLKDKELIDVKTTANKYYVFITLLYKE